MEQNVGVGDELSFLLRLNRATQPSLSVGPGLTALNTKSFSLLEASLSKFAGGGRTIVNMYDWVRERSIMATTAAVFGPKNPFEDPAVLTAWIQFETVGMPLLALDALPEWAIGDGVRAREMLVKAFRQYLEIGGFAEASEFVQRRISFYKEEGLPSNDISRLAVADNIAFNSNLVPTIFWLLYHVFSDKLVLDACRAEINKAIRYEKDGTPILVYDFLKNSCPILQSTFQEVLRYHGFGLVPRRALEDHMLDGKYLIKKGGTIFTPYRVQHHDAENWGDDHALFRHGRFLKEAGYKRHNPVALRGFGNGAHLCPGRHFATAEILLFTALMVTRFDAQPCKGSWPSITVEMSSQVAAVDQPDHDVEVEFTPREGVRQGQWAVDFETSAN